MSDVVVGFESILVEVGSIVVEGIDGSVVRVDESDVSVESLLLLLLLLSSLLSLPDDDGEEDDGDDDAVGEEDGLVSIQDPARRKGKHPSVEWRRDREIGGRGKREEEKMR